MNTFEHFLVGLFMLGIVLQIGVLCAVITAVMCDEYNSLRIKSPHWLYIPAYTGGIGLAIFLLILVGRFMESTCLN